jgi:anti-sigma regulatory factor (Ser/Thr protein kinase)
MSLVAASVSATPQFLHEAFLYADDAEYLAGTVPFIQEGLDAGEPVLVAVPARKLDLLRTRFDPSQIGLLRFTPMETMGRNPAWIIPAWAQFVDDYASNGRAARGIGEPIWYGRSDDELVECGRHESLLNLAFADVSTFKLLCPYDTALLGGAVIEEAHRNHPRIARGGVLATSDTFDGRVPPWIDTPLSPVPATAARIDFDAGGLGDIRRRAAAAATEAGMRPPRIADLVVAVSEAVTNSLRHGGGSGQVFLWRDGLELLCEIRDHGRVSDPLAGRRRPGIDEPSGRGLWLMNQLCELVQIRALPHGQVVRLHVLI